MTEHIILVAFQVDTANTVPRSVAHAHLQGQLVPLLSRRDPDSAINAWWVAEDDRDDGSDLDSAVFVTPGKTAVASRILHAAGLTPDVNICHPTTGQFPVTSAEIHEGLVDAINTLTESPKIP